MSSYRGLDLFGSGPHVIEAGGVALRGVVHEGPGADGARVTDLGRGARKLNQRGRLMADELSEAEGLAGEIEKMLDGGAGELVDEMGRVWGDVVMMRFERRSVERAGTRWAMGYEVEYVQVVV